MEGLKEMPQILFTLKRTLMFQVVLWPKEIFFLVYFLPKSCTVKHHYDHLNVSSTSKKIAIFIDFCLEIPFQILYHLLQLAPGGGSLSQTILFPIDFQEKDVGFFHLYCDRQFRMHAITD